MNSGILCNYCRTRQAYFLDKSRNMAACGLCIFDVASYTNSRVSLFTHWTMLAETGPVEGHAVARSG